MSKKPDPTKQSPIVEELIYDSYLAAIHGSIGANTWRKAYAKIDGIKTEITLDGILSCAYFVSSILRMFDLIGSVHMTVEKTEKDMQESGWVKINKPKPGAVIFWEKLMFKEGLHAHNGFYIGGGKAISNSEEVRTPIEHDWQDSSDGRARKIEAIYWHPKFDL